MGELELLERAFLAAAIGLLVGVERGWQEREAADGARVAGIRTFTLVGMLGGICGLLARGSPVTLGLFFLAFALPFGIFEWRRASQAGSYSATDLVAGLLTFALGSYATWGSMILAGAAGVTATFILAERRLLHGFLRCLTWKEFRAALLLLVMTAVLLPVLPDRTLDPWKAFNPHQIWLLTVLVAAVSYGGYIGIRLAGERAGLLIAALLGGLATSTTVTWTFARMARRDAAISTSVMSAILAAWIVSLLRMTAVAAIITPALLRPLAPAILASSLVLAIPAVLAWRVAGKSHAHGLALDDPFDLMLMLRFMVLLAGIMLLAKFFSSAQSGLLALGAGTGLLDVDPITLSMAKLAGSGLAPQIAASIILVAATANGLAKSVLAFAFGGKRLGGMLGASALVAFLAGLAGFVWFG